MQQESRFVDREEDGGSDRRLFQWVAPCCGEDECSASFEDKRKKFASYVSEEAWQDMEFEVALDSSVSMPSKRDKGCVTGQVPPGA